MLHKTIHLKEYFPLLGQNNCDPTLDLYLPYNMTEMNRQDQKRPCMVIVPGGGYGMVSQREGEPIALHLLPEGFNVFVLTYSVAPNRFPTQLREVAAAMELIHANAEDWNCDTDKIFIMGFSAGGHLAAHYSNCYACDQVRQVFPGSKPVSGTVLAYPVITTDPRYYYGGSFVNLLGYVPETEAEKSFFSCNQQVTEATPPTFIWHTAPDGCVPVNNSLLYAQALSANKVPFELHIYPLGGHGLSTADKHTCDGLSAGEDRVQEWLAALKNWLRQFT